MSIFKHRLLVYFIVNALIDCDPNFVCVFVLHGPAQVMAVGQIKFHLVSRIQYPGHAKSDRITLLEYYVISLVSRLV